MSKRSKKRSKKKSEVNEFPKVLYVRREKSYGAGG